MKKLIKELIQGEILLYAIVGISCFAFCYICFAFVFKNINAFTWEESDRFEMILCTLGSLFMYTIHKGLKN